MNEKQIRDILIEYVKAKTKKARIFQEKSIGSSICDLMAVTDKIIGFEIKSDLDNYTRLERQIEAYDKFFDMRYIVVGKSHYFSVREKVPNDWGILVIEKTQIECLRVAKTNERKDVTAKKQLSLLWKLELKNILIKNSLPMFAQKDKAYIADRILESVQTETLKTQIVEELHSRDYSLFDVKDFSIKFDEESDNLPKSEMVDMLSEINLAEFTLDKWIALYNQATQLQEQKEIAFERRVSTQHEHIAKYTDITVSLGVPWVSVYIVNDFAKELFWPNNVTIDNSYLYNEPTYDIVKYEPITGAWMVETKNFYSYNTRIYSEYGTQRFNGLYILESILNLREIKIFDGKKFNECETIAALEKKTLIEKAFQEWIWKDPDRIWEVEEAYNKIFSKFSEVKYDGSKLEFPNMAEGFSLFDYQKDAVQKIINSDNTLLAFDVGAGKTFIMIAAAMMMRQSGLSRKNMFVVPNNIVGQWEKIFTDLYPKAKVLTVEPKYFKPQVREKVLQQMQSGDYDGIIIAYSCFEMIPLSEQILKGLLEQNLSNINEALKNSYLRDRTALERKKTYIKKQMAELLNTLDTPISDITFDKLEINTLFLDEAHNYKNVPIRTCMRNLRGINTKGSLKCFDMLQKVRHVQNYNNGRGVVFATGTPISNSISDVFTMQTYLQYDELERNNLDVFDNWVKTFAYPEQVFEIDVDTTKYRMVQRFSKFFNLPELSKMFKGIACFYAMNGADMLPEIVNYDNVIIPKSDALSEYMLKISERADKIRNKDVDRSKDNMLKLCNDGRKAALDLRLVGCVQPMETAKINNCVNNIFKIYSTYPNSSQLVFCDWSTPKDEFNIYAEIKAQLISLGVSRKEIVFIHSYNSESKKVKLFDDVNSAKIRVLIGSTFKLGIGANVQTRLKAIHHLDVPWRPADMVQREGRILRRGNLNKEVSIYRYIVEGSFDSYSWQVLETKQRFISQFLGGSTYQRSISDLEDNVLTYAEVKAIALNNPLMKDLAEKQNKLKNYQILYSKELEEKEHLRQEKEEKTLVTHRLTEKIKATKENLDFAKNNIKAIKEVLKSIQNSLCLDNIMKDDYFICEFCSFTVKTPREQKADKPYVLLIRNGAQYEVEMGEFENGNAQRIFNQIQKLDNAIEKMQEIISKYRQYIIDVEARIIAPTVYDIEVQKMTKIVDKLMSKIKFE